LEENVGGTFLRKRFPQTPSKTFLDCGSHLVLADFLFEGIFLGLCVAILYIPSADISLVRNSSKIVMGKSGSAKTLTSHAVWRYVDKVSNDRIQLRFGIPRTPWLPPFVLFKKDFMSANRTNVKRGRRASQDARKPNKM